MMAKYLYPSILHTTESANEEDVSRFPVNLPANVRRESRKPGAFSR